VRGRGRFRAQQVLRAMCAGKLYRTVEHGKRKLRDEGVHILTPDSNCDRAALRMASNSPFLRNVWTRASMAAFCAGVVGSSLIFIFLRTLGAESAPSNEARLRLVSAIMNERG
jgi:hypothetical protein